MPAINCPACGREVSFPDYFYGTVIACPTPACGKPIQLPNADGSMPVAQAAPPPIPKPQPADKYYLRRHSDRDMVVGPLPRAKLRQLAAKEQLQWTDEISTDGRNWQQARKRDPGLFQAEETRNCPACGLLLKEAHQPCPNCSRQDADEEEAGTYGVSKVASLHAGQRNPLLERSIVAPCRLSDFASARGADAVVGVNDDGWLGLWRASDGQGLRTWEFEPGRRVRLVVADQGNLAIVAVEHKRSTRIYLAEFEYRKLNELAELNGHVKALMLSPDGERLTLVDDAPDVRIYRVNPWKRLDRFPVRGHRFEISPVGDRLAAAYDNGAVNLWNLRTGKVEFELGTGREPAGQCLPLRMGFSRTGKRLFTATGIIVRFVEKQFDGVDPFSAWLLLGIPGIIINNNAKMILDAIRPNDAELRRRLEHYTTVRLWSVEKGRLVDELGDAVIQKHPTGIADAVFWPWGSAAITLGQGTAHAWDLSTGNSLGQLYQLANEAEVRRAAEHVDPDRAALKGHPTLIRRIDFTKGGKHALVLVCGSREIQVVRWPQETAE